MDARDRFFEVRDALGLTDYRIYTDVKGVTKGMLDRLRQGVTTEISNKWLIPFLEAYPQVNANYILTGNGSMFIQTTNGGNRMYEEKCKEVEDLKKENKLLKSDFCTLEIRYKSLLESQEKPNEAYFDKILFDFYKDTAEDLLREVAYLKEELAKYTDVSQLKSSGR